MSVRDRPGLALGLLTSLNILNYTDRYVGAAILPLIISGLALSDGQAGPLQSVFILVYVIASPIAGWLGDRGGRLRLAAAGVLIWSAATAGSGLAPTFVTLLIARALVGFGEAGYAVVTPSLLSDLYPAERRGRAMAVFYTAMPVGAAIGYMAGGWLGERFGWRTAFYAAGAPGLLLALALLVLREPSRGRYDRPDTRPVELSLPASLRALWARKSYLVNTAAQTIYSFAMGGLGFWMPTYFVRERQLPPARAGLLFGLVLVLAGFLGTILGGQIGDRLAKRFRTAPFALSGGALVASLPFTLLAVLSAHPAIFWPAMFATLFLLFLNTGPLNAAMANVLPPDLRARGFALYTVAIHLLGDALSPTLIGLASNRMGLRIPVLVTGLLLVPAGLVLLLGRRTLVADLEAQSS